MLLIDFISEEARKDRLVAALDTSAGYLWQLATNWRGKRPSAEMARAIERATAEIGPEAVPAASLRPDLFGEMEPSSPAQQARVA